MQTTCPLDCQANDLILKHIHSIALHLVAHWLERLCASLVAQVWFLLCPIQRQLLQGGTRSCHRPCFRLLHAYSFLFTILVVTALEIATTFTFTLILIWLTDSVEYHKHYQQGFNNTKHCLALLQSIINERDMPRDAGISRYGTVASLHVLLAIDCES